MPTYCYKTEDGDIIERVFRMGEAPEVIEIPLDPYGSGFKVAIATRDYQSEGVSGTVIGSDNPTCRLKPQRPWPMAPCVGSGVHASQAAELRKHLADRGCPTEVTSDGDPIYTSAAHRRRALKVRGFQDKASFS